MFGRVAFGHELGSASKVLNRWEGPIRYRVAGPATPAQRAIIDRQMAELDQLSGIGIAAGEPANFIIHTGPRPGAADLRTVFPSVGPSALSGLGQARCFFLFQAEGGAIRQALAFVPAALEEAAFRHCVAEETTQALGLPSDEGPAGSIFNDDSAAQELAPIDRLLLRALYAPELRAGMPRGQAMQAIRPVFIRLLGE